MNRCLLALALAVLCLMDPGHLRAQRARTPAPAPATFAITPIGEGYRVALTVEARERVELSADRRWLRAEVRDARGRRLPCTQPSRPRVGSRVRTLEAGERWSEWLDVRELCWGRSLEALSSARELTFHFDAGRARGAWVVRAALGPVRALPPVSSSWRAPSPQTADVGEGALRVRLAAADAALARRPTFRVGVTATSAVPVRAFVRPEFVSFHVVAPSGRSFECAMSAFDGRPLPDFFSRLSRARPLTLSLDAQAYCGRFEEPGIYEVTPVVTLRERGAEWRLEAITGVFRGAPAALRVRSSTYVEQPWEGS